MAEGSRVGYAFTCRRLLPVSGVNLLETVVLANHATTMSRNVSKH